MITANNINISLDLFTSATVPKKSELISDWEFDALDREHAIEIFSGRKQSEIYSGIKEETYGNMSDIEDLFVLSNMALSYYIEPYMSYLLFDVDETVHEDDTVHLFFFYFNEYMNTSSEYFFDKNQAKVLLQLIQFYIQKANNCSEQNTDRINGLLDNLYSLEEHFEIFLSNTTDNQRA